MTDVPNLPDFPDIPALLNKFADRVNATLNPPKPNRRQRRAQGKPRRSRRETQLQAIMRLKGKGRTRRPASRR